MKLTEQQIRLIARREARKSTSANVGGSSAGVSEAWVNENFISKDFFSSLFTIHGSGSSVIEPNDVESRAEDIEAKVGLWTESFISALGKGAGDDGGSASSLAELIDVSLSGTKKGQALVFDGTHWTNGDVSVDLAEYATQEWVKQQGYLTQHQSLAGYATQEWVKQQGYLTSYTEKYTGTVTSVGLTVPTGFSVTGAPVVDSGTIAISFARGYSLPTNLRQGNWDTAYDYTTDLNVKRTAWGQTFWDDGPLSLSGSLHAGANGGTLSGFHSIEMNSVGSLSGYGGFIDFHFNGSTDDYTSRIIEDQSGRIAFYSQVFIPSHKSLRIGDALLTWDSANSTLRIENFNGTAANICASGGVIALG